MINLSRRKTCVWSCMFQRDMKRDRAKQKRSLVAGRDELVQQLQQLVTSLSVEFPASSTSAFTCELINITQDTVDTATALLTAADHHHSDQLYDKTLTVLDLASVLLLLNCSDQKLVNSSVTPRPTAKRASDLVVGFLIMLYVLIVWFVEIWFAMTQTRCPV